MTLHPALVRAGKEIVEELVINKEQVPSIHQLLKETIYEAFAKALRNDHQQSHHSLSASFALPRLWLL